MNYRQLSKIYIHNIYIISKLAVRPMNYSPLLNTPTEQSTEHHNYFKKTTKNIFQEITETNLMTPNSKSYLLQNQCQFTSKSIITTQIKDPCDSCPLFSSAGLNHLNDNTLEMASLKFFSSISIPSSVDLKLQNQDDIHLHQCLGVSHKKGQNREKLCRVMRPHHTFIESSLTVQKKSYRHVRTHNPEIVPYRKHIDPLQTRIVAIINKILQKKPYIKEIQNILSRLEKMNSRELLNKFIVSGVKTIKNLLQGQSLNIIHKIDQVLQKMNTAIENQLTDTSDYTYEGQHEIIDIQPLKRKLILRIYHLLKSSHHDLSMNSLKDMAVKIFNEYIHQNQGNITKKSIINFLRLVSKKYIRN